MPAQRGKWFEIKEHRTAKKFAQTKSCSLWKIELARKDRMSGKLVRTKRYYAGSELPAAAQGKNAAVEEIGV